MDDTKAKILLDNTFDNEFDINRFEKFIVELFNHFNWRPKELHPWKEYWDYVESVCSFGTYPDYKTKDIEVFAVKLKGKSSRDRARTMQRNLIARYLREFNIKAALVAFYEDHTNDWRFSFVKMEYELFKDEKGNLRIEENLTPAKRYSFLIGEKELNHTCKKQFFNLIKNEEIDPTLEDIESVFSIETVTKEFFKEYERLYLELKKSLKQIIAKDDDVKREFDLKNISTSDFAKKLMGQLVFIYFLQKKGWLGVKEGEPWGSGPKNFLRQLFNEKKSNNNFFNDVLEVLFYKALAFESPGDFHGEFNCKIPFLNGGLFEPINDYDWRNTNITLNDKIFEEIMDTFDRFNFTVKEDEPLEKEVAIDPEMLGKVFENLLEIKDRKTKGTYYTPREIVHYMCQQSLINHLNTNSDISLADIEEFIQLGDFALDLIIREKIRFNESLKGKKYGLPVSIKENYQELDKLLQDIKIVDPAAGSGAFPVGMMNEIVKARSILSIFFDNESDFFDERKNYNLKRETIEKSLYCVDIDSSAVEITKLRFWLSLIVDEEDIENIKALPNLDHKIICGNSLLEEFEGIKLFDEKFLVEIPEKDSELINKLKKLEDSLYKQLGLIETGKMEDNGRKNDIKRKLKKIDSQIKKLSSKPDEIVIQSTLFGELSKSQIKLQKLQKLQNKFFGEQNKKEKDKIRNNIEKIEWDLIEETLKEEGNEEAIQKLQKYKLNESKPFFIWKLYFSEVFQRENPGFDIVIANPPYIGEDSNKDMFRPIAEGNLSDFYQGKMDIFYFFFHLALNIGRDDSQIAFITTNYYPTATGADKLRKDFKKRAIIRKLINFSELKIFESAKGQHNMITILSKGEDDNFIAENCESKRTGLADFNILMSILNWNDSETEYYSVPQSDLYDGESDYIRLMGTKNEESLLHQILDKIKDESDDLLGNICSVNQGVVSGCDKLTNKSMAKLKDTENVYLKDGIYIFDLKNKRDLDVINNFTSHEKKLLMPFFKNSEINRYWCNKTHQKFLLYLDKNTENLNDYPNIKSHLNNFREILDDRREVKEKKIKYFSLQWPRTKEIFEKPKICVPYRPDINSFAYNEVPWYCRSDCYVITEKNRDIKLKYILGLLNSKLFYIWLYHRGKRKGRKLELFKTPLSEIPIKLSKEKEVKIVSLVNEILKITNDENYLKNKESISKVRKLEEKIDNEIFDMYNISKEEREIIYAFNEDLFN